MKYVFFLILILLILYTIPVYSYVNENFILDSYYPMIYNQIDIYKLNKGLNYNKTKPYMISGFGTTTKSRVDLFQQQVIISTNVGEFNIHPDVVISLDKYIDNIQLKAYRQSLISQFLTIQTQTTTQTGGLIKDITIDLPSIAVPKAIRRILGSKAGRLNLDGTQRITLSASSTKRKLIPIYETNRGSKFDIKMQQETNLRLSGTIGEKISVSLKYNSNQDETFFDPNNINLKYTGDEDEIVQSVEAGNIALSLSGSRYISYSTSSQGLFGIVTKLKYGAVDVTMIASKEEGQKNTMTYLGQSQADSTVIFSKNYASRTFYYLEDPYDIYNLYTSADTSVPPGWVNNAIKTTAGAWQIRYPELLPKNGSVRVYIDDGDATNNIASIQGDTIFVSIGEYYIPYYDELIEGTDFITNYNIGTIEILKPIDRRYTVGVQYIRRNDTPIPANSMSQNQILNVKVLRKRNQEYSPENPYTTWDYQMRNVYKMGISNVKKDDFRLDIYTENVDRTRNYNVPDSLSFSGIITYNDYLNLDTSGDGRVNADDTTVNLSSGYIIVPFIKPFDPLGDTIIYREENESISFNDFKYFISVKGKIGRDIITLGQTGVLKGSVRVKVNGITQKENIDYIVDYDMGQITFLSIAGKDPDAKIEIDYEYRSGFASARKSLVGIRADMNFSENAKIGGTAIYRSESVGERRPKIGSENMRLFLANLDGSISWKPGFITRWLDAIPLINTSSESRISISAEAALTIPDIYGDTKNKNQAYIDDMEGILDSYPLGLSFSTWVLGSKPWQTSLSKGRIYWYNPLNKKMSDVYDTATLNESDRNETISILTLKLVPNDIQNPGLMTTSYSGIMKYLGNQLDFSNKKYIELLVKVDKLTDVNPNITFYIDLGDINEDFYTENGGLNVLNTEDKNGDGVLSLSEDTGLDGITNGQPGDDANDNFDFNRQDSDKDYTHRNGTEGNNLLDTEDLDNNGVLNQLDRYLSYSTSITNTNHLQNPYLIDYIHSTGFMLIRIPLDDVNAYQIVNNSTSGVQPTLKKVSYVRMWAETDQKARILIANASIVGNKWEDFYIRDNNNNIIHPSVLTSNNESYISGVVDNQKSTHYTSPKKTFFTEYNKPTLEQALTIKATNLQPGHQALLRQRIIDFYNLLSYNKILLWAYPENGETSIYSGNDSLTVVFRLGADSLNYYQVRQNLKIHDYHTNTGRMLESNWYSLEFNLQDFSKIKDSLIVGEELLTDGKFYSYKGIPTLTNIREFVLGIQRKADDNIPYTGITYFNDVRVADPFEDIGWANRISVNSVLADVSTLDIDFEHKSENFNPNLQRGRTQSTLFATSNSLRISNKYFLNKFLPVNWGAIIPLSLDRNYTQSIPRYKANSDVLRSSILDPDDKERERSENLVHSANIGISQNILTSSPLIQYTINKMALSGRISNTINNTATTRDTTLAWQGTYSYNLTIPENTLTYNLWKNYRVKLLPGGYTNNFTINASFPNSYNWEKRDTIRTWFPRAQSVDTKMFTTDNGFTWALTSDLNSTYRLISKRDMMQKNYYHNLNIGKETEYSQDIGANYNPNYFPNIFNISNSISSRFIENQRKYSSYSTGVQEFTYLKDGNSTRTFRINMTVLNSQIFSRIASNLRSGSIRDKKDEIDKRKKNIDSSVPDYKNQDKEELRRQEESRKKELEEDYIRKNEEHLIDPAEIDKKEQYMHDIANEILAEKSQPSDTLKSSADKKITDVSGVNLTSSFFELVSKAKNIVFTFQNGFSQIYTSQNSRPNFGFQIGLPNQVSSSFLDSRSYENTYTLGSGYTFSRRMDSILNYSYQISQRYANASNQVIVVTFPDISISFSELETLLGVSQYVSNLRLNTGYQHNLRQNGDINWEKPKQETITNAFNPLASITANIANKVQTTLSYTMSLSQNNTDMITYVIRRNTATQGLSGNLSYSFQSSTGIELPFTKRKINIRNELTSSMSVSYERNYDTTRGSGDTQVDRNTSRFSIAPTATYRFDHNIRGGLTSGYEITSDKKRDDGTRIFRLGIWVEINL